MPRAAGEGRRIALVGGEAGSGKSRLVREFAHRGRRRGRARAVRGVRRGRAHPLPAARRGARPARPWRRSRRSCAPIWARAAASSTRLCPTSPTSSAPLPPPVSADQDTERHRLHQAVADLLVNIGARRPRLLVLEDAHWADGPTLLLLRHLARAAADARLLLVATFRDTEADVPARALVDAGRPAPLRGRRAGAARRPHGQRDRGAGRRGRPAGSSATSCPESPRRCTTSPRATRSWSSSCGASSSRPGRSIVDLDGRAAAPADRRARAPPRRCARSSASGSPGWTPRPSPCSSWPRWSAPSSTSRSSPRPPARRSWRRSRRWTRPSGAAWWSSVPERPLGYCFSPRAGAPRAVRPAVGACAGPSSTCAPARRSSRRRASASLAELAHHFTAAAPLGDTERAVDYNLRAAAAASAALAFDQAADALRRRALQLGIADVHDRALIKLDLGEACFRAGASTEALAAYPTSPPSPARSTTASCRPAPRSASRTRAGGWAWPTRRRCACWRRPRPGSTRATRRCG